MTREDWIRLGAWLRAQRKELGISVGEIAQATGVDRTWIYTVERARRERERPSVAVLASWLRLFGIDLLARIGVRE